MFICIYMAVAGYIYRYMLAYSTYILNNINSLLYVYIFVHACQFSTLRENDYN